VTGLLATDKGLGLYSSSAGDGGAPQPIQMSPVLAMLCGHASDPGVLPTHGGAAGAVAAQPQPAHESGFVRGLFGRIGGRVGTGTGMGTGMGTVRPDGKPVIAGAEAVMNVPGSRGLGGELLL
jgi:hypothetical protein